MLWRLQLDSFAALTGAAGAPSIVDETALEFHAKSGSAVRFVLDRETALPLRAEIPSFDGTRTVTFSDLERLYGMPLGGLLGFDFLSRFVTDIDYVRKTLTLRPRTFDTSRIEGERVPLVMQGEQPYFGGSIVVRGGSLYRRSSTRSGT